MRRDAGAVRTSLFPPLYCTLFVFSLATFALYSSTLRIPHRHRRRLLRRGTSTPRDTQMPVILHPPVPFMDIATRLLHRTSTLRICVNYYTRIVYVHGATYICITSPRTGPSLLLPLSVVCIRVCLYTCVFVRVCVVNFGPSNLSCEV